MGENNSLLKNALDQHGNEASVKSNIKEFERNTSQTTYALYKEALHTNDAQAVSNLTASMFKTGGKKAIENLTDFMIDNYFANPDCSETMLKQVASLFLPAANKAGVTTNFQTLEYRIREKDEKDWSFGKKNQAATRLYYALDEKYKKPSNDPNDPIGQKLDQRIEELSQ